MSFDFFFFSFRDTGILSTRKFMLVNEYNQKGLLSNRASSIFNVLEILPKQQELICSDPLFTNLWCRWIGRLSCKDGYVTTDEMFWAQPKNLQSYSIISNCNKENMNWSLKKMKQMRNTGRRSRGKFTMGWENACRVIIFYFSAGWHYYFQP